MKHVHAFRKGLDPQSGLQPVRLAVRACLIPGPFRLAAGAALLLALCLAVPARAQVTAAGNGGGLSISAGAMASGYYVGYGERKLLGYSVFADADTRRRIGLQAEGHWLRYEKVANSANRVDASTYLIGGRYHYDFGRSFQVYGKGMIGEGLFKFPYGAGHGSYFVVAPGAGVDYHISGRFFWRADAEYQLWPGFTFGTPATYTMTSYGVSTGFRVRVF